MLGGRVGGRGPPPSERFSVVSPWTRLHPAPALHRSLPGLHGGEDRRVGRHHLGDHEADPGSQSHPQHLQDDRVAPAGHLRLPQVGVSVGAASAA